jgi:putative ABC transport system ATP-binding protein
MSAHAAVLSGVSRVYPGRVPVTALTDVALEVRDGEMLAITGPSGSGKSTLLHLLGGLDVPTKGRVTVLGTDLAALDEDARALFRRRHVSYVFQAYHLMPTLSCAENISLPLLLRGDSGADTRVRVAEALDMVGLAARADHLPDELSGGECQRVAIARAIVGGPRILLADEPTGNLDSTTGQHILDCLTRLHRDRRMTVVLVTHDPHLAARCQRILRLVDGRLTDDVT